MTQSSLSTTPSQESVVEYEIYSGMVVFEDVLRHGSLTFSQFVPIRGRVTCCGNRNSCSLERNHSYNRGA